MSSKFLLRRVFLVFLLKELNYSSAFPRVIGRSSTSPESWRVQREKQQDEYGFGNRRPLHYIRALRQAAQTSNTSDQDQVIPLTELEESPLNPRSFAPIQNQLHPSHSIQNPYQPWSGTTMVQEMSPTLTALQKNHLLSKPRSFELNLKLPFANFPGQKKEKDSSIKGSSLSSGGTDELYRPTNVQLYTGFNSPTGSDEKASTKNPNDGKSTHDVTKPSFQFNLNVPLPPPSPSPSSTKVVHPNPQSNPVKGGSEWVLLNSPSVQQPTQHLAYEPIHTQSIDSKLVTFPPGPLSQLTFLAEPSSQSAQQTVQYPQQSDHIYGGYYSPQTQPTKSDHGNSQVVQTPSPDATNIPQSPLQYESAPSGYYSPGQTASSNNYAQPQTLQPVSPQLTSPPEKYDHSQVQATYGLSQNIQTASHPSPPVVDQPRYDIPSSGYYDGSAATSNHYGKGNMEQTDSSYQYINHHSGHGLLPNHPTTSDLTSNYQSPSSGYQTQMGLPDQYNNRPQLSGKPSYTKLLINMDDVTYDDGGQYSNSAAQTPHYYSGGNEAETHPNNQAYMPIYNQAPVVESGAGQYASYYQAPVETEQSQPSNSPHAYVNYGPAVGGNAGTAQTILGQQEPSFQPGQGSHYPSHGQHFTNQWQPQYPSQQSNYPVPDDGIQQPSTYGPSYYTNPAAPY